MDVGTNAQRKRPREEPSAAALLARAEQELEHSRVEVAQMDGNMLKRMILSVEKRINENMQMRMKYADTPEKFMDSELELYQQLKALHPLATTPELYPTFVESGGLRMLINLLNHNNTDIAVGVATQRNGF